MPSFPPKVSSYTVTAKAAHDRRLLTKDVQLGVADAEGTVKPVLSVTTLLGWDYTLYLGHNVEMVVPPDQPLVVIDPDSIGLYAKYHVTKPDGTPVDDCFVLRPARDPAAFKALELYATLVEEDTPALAEDLRQWLDELKGVL